METTITPAEAWQDFQKNVVPVIWSGLSEKDKNRLITARRDYDGKRKKPNGVLYALGADRIERILTTYAPGRYRFEKTVVVYIQS